MKGAVDQARQAPRDSVLPTPVGPDHQDILGVILRSGSATCARASIAQGYRHRALAASWPTMCLSSLVDDFFRGHFPSANA